MVLWKENPFNTHGNFNKFYELWTCKETGAFVWLKLLDHIKWCKASNGMKIEKDFYLKSSQGFLALPNHFFLRCCSLYFFGKICLYVCIRPLQLMLKMMFKIKVDYDARRKSSLCCCKRQCVGLSYLYTFSFRIRSFKVSTFSFSLVIESKMRKYNFSYTVWVHFQ